MFYFCFLGRVRVAVISYFPQTRFPATTSFEEYVVGERIAAVVGLCTGEAQRVRL